MIGFTKWKNHTKSLTINATIKKSPHTDTHTGSIMSLPFAYFIPMNRPYHTSVNSKRKSKKRFDGRWRWKIFITGCICMHFFRFYSIFRFFFSSYTLSFWTNRQVMKAGMVFVIYLTCLNIIHTHIYSIIWDKIRMMKIDTTIIILYELENDHKSVKKYRFPISHFFEFFFLLLNVIKYIYKLIELYLYDSCFEF